MKKRILSLALAAMLVFAFVPSAFAAYTVTVSQDTGFGGGVWFEAVISNVTSEGTTSAEAATSHIERVFEEYDLWWLDISGDVPVYYCDAPAKVEFFGGIAAIYWSGEIGEFINNSYLSPDEDEAVRGDVTFTAPGDYVIAVVSFDESLKVFYVSIGGSAAVISAPVEAAPAVPAAGDAATLKTTDGLVSVIPPSPVFTTYDIQYTVAEGDRLYAIARKHGVTVDKIKAENKAYFDSLAEINKANGTRVEVEAGVTLKIKTVTEAYDLAYTVQKDETLMGIAFNYYGSMREAHVKKIKDANADYFKNTKGVLEAGAVIILPGEGLRIPVTQRSLSSAAGMYLVKAGDTLSEIASKYYGSSRLWSKIYEANKDRVLIIENRTIIYENQWLVIPE